MWGNDKSLKFYSEESEGKRNLGTGRCRWENIIVSGSQLGTMAVSCLRDNDSSDSLEAAEFPYPLSEFHYSCILTQCLLYSKEKVCIQNSTNRLYFLSHKPNSLLTRTQKCAVYNTRPYITEITMLCGVNKSARRAR